MGIKCSGGNDGVEGVTLDMHIDSSNMEVNWLRNLMRKRR